jgi:hypothetical protein
MHDYLSKTVQNWWNLSRLFRFKPKMPFSENEFCSPFGVLDKHIANLGLCRNCTICNFQYLSILGRLSLNWINFIDTAFQNKCRSSHYRIEVYQVSASPVKLQFVGNFFVFQQWIVCNERLKIWKVFWLSTNIIWSSRKTSILFSHNHYFMIFNGLALGNFVPSSWYQI